MSSDDKVSFDTESTSDDPSNALSSRLTRDSFVLGAATTGEEVRSCFRPAKASGDGDWAKDLDVRVTKSVARYLAELKAETTASAEMTGPGARDRQRSMRELGAAYDVLIEKYWGSKTNAIRVTPSIILNRNDLITAVKTALSTAK